jgi:putative ABC transport system permease protein
MPFTEALKLAFGSILSHKLRSFLTLLGVIFGVGTVIVVVSLIEGFNAYVDDKIANIGTNAFSVQRFSIEDFSSVEAMNAARRRNKDVTIDDLKAIEALDGSIGAAAGKAATMADVKYDETTLFNVQISGVSPSLHGIQGIEEREGRYFIDAEDESRRFVCFIGSELADKLFSTGGAVGRILKVDGRTYQVIGVGKEQGSAFGQTRDMYVSIPLQTFLTVYGVRRSISITVASTTPETYDDAIEQVRTLMRVRRKVEPDEKDSFGIVTPSAINQLRDAIFGTIQVAAIGVTSISLIVGGIVIMNIMLVSVTERTKEIGIRKSIGARQSDVLKQFLAESTTLALVGGSIGVAVAYLIAKFVAVVFGIPTALPLVWVTISLVVSSSVGLVSGVYPAWKAARLDPIEALRAD